MADHGLIYQAYIGISIMEDIIRDVTEQSFEQDVVEASRTRPVLVDFWAEWCAPCKALKPILEKLARERGGEFILAKVDTDRQPQLAGRFGIRGIPNVKAFVDGKVVGEFSGAIPESAVRAFLEKWIPSRVQGLRIAAGAALREGDFEGAEAKLNEALNLEPDEIETRLDLVELLLARQAYSEADLQMRHVPERLHNPRAENLVVRIDRWKRVQSMPGLPELEERLAKSPEDQELRLQLAERHIAEGRHEAALEFLIEVVRRDRGGLRDRARKAMLDVFRMADPESELVSRYRRLLSSALY